MPKRRQHVPLASAPWGQRTCTSDLLTGHRYDRTPRCPCAQRSVTCSSTSSSRQELARNAATAPDGSFHADERGACETTRVPANRGWHGGGCPVAHADSPGPAPAVVSSA